MECLRRDLIVLIHQFLVEEGFSETAESFNNEVSWDLDQFRVCDNVDLQLVFMEYLAYYQVSFYKYSKSS